MSLDFRTVDPASPALTSYLENVAFVFHDDHPVTAERVDARRPFYVDQRLTGAFDGDLCVGTFRSWDTTLTVPGGSVVADAVSTVTVRPTHRRRGVLTRLMHDDLAAAADRGVPVAILFASEGLIYGRYGYGVATRTASVEVDVRRAHVHPSAPRAGRVDVVPGARAREVAEVVFAAARRPGEIDHFPHWWDSYFGLATMPGDTPPLRHHVVHTADDGTPTGFLGYRVKEDWQERSIETVVHLDELRAATPQAYVALWRYLAELDLVKTVKAGERPVDEALPGLLTDVRAVRLGPLLDFQWHRLLDPAAALSARRYERPGTAVLEVVDPAGGWAAGTYTLEVGDDGRGVCTRTPGAAAGVTLPVGVLSGVWLGGGDLRAAGWAGLAVEHTAGALDGLAALLRTAEPPYSGTIF